MPIQNHNIYIVIIVLLYKMKHKHKFQFVQKWSREELIDTGKKFEDSDKGQVYAEFICLCGEQRLVEVNEVKK